jgi:hypothetical protein
MYYLCLFIFIGRKIQLVAMNLDASETNSIRLHYMLRNALHRICQSVSYCKIRLQYIHSTCSAIRKCDHEYVMKIGMIIALQVCGDISKK